VLLISGIVTYYSGDYMGHDTNLFRFLVILILFVVSMVLMIFSPNIISILLGWDGLGLVSYCLVIYYQNMKSLNAGLLTILSNRVGDVAILLRISWLFNYGAWNFFLLEHMYRLNLGIIMGLVILAALTKSAQIPFSAWLPAAMAAPTPISALVHSSTLVTAGVYLLIRFSELVGVRRVLYYLSVGTIFMSGFGANFEIDLKKIIALSTLRQLGVIIISLSLGIVELAFFHLLMHALFKSLLFLCAGVYIHGSGDKQDIRSLGGLIESAPLTTFYFLGCSLALCGFPYISGFYSKDIILEI
jgi:NADH-ubiquinone oxidoreductase chain 5